MIEPQRAINDSGIFFEGEEGGTEEDQENTLIVDKI